MKSRILKGVVQSGRYSQLRIAYETMIIIFILGGKMRLLKVILAIIMMGFFSIPGNGFPNEGVAQKDIVENVEVNWWQVPVFAVDKDGNPVLDLKETDIQLWMNNHPVKEFVFYKRSFDLVQKQKTAVSDQREVVEKKQLAPLKKQVIILLFDTAFSKAACTKRSQKIAKEIIKNSAPDTQFVLLSIEPFKGLNHVYGPTDSKKELVHHIGDSIIPKFNDPFMKAKTFKGIQNGLQNYYLRKTHNFFDAFESLYLILNSIRENKFVYFFSEGISQGFIGKIKGGETMFNFFTKRGAQLLGRSGIVLFIVNPMGVSSGYFLTSERTSHVLNNNGSPSSSFLKEQNLSGETQLRLLATESGGKYLEGVNEEIIETLEQMHRAYYEISFPDLPGLKGNIRDIVVKSKRKGITLHTLRFLEKNKKYVEMTGIEKEVVALNLISGNPLFKSKVSAQPVSVYKIKKQKGKFIYHIRLPKEFIGQSLDMYKCWVKEDQEVISMENESLQPAKGKIKISFKIKEKHNQNLKPYFVLINGKTEIALVRVIGDDWIDEENQPVQATPSKSKIIHSSISDEELQKLLTNTANYCEQLKESAFHFYCKEKITEIQDHMFSDIEVRLRRSRPYWNNPTGIDRQLKDISNDMPMGKPNTREENNYSFGYRLLKNGEKITEERQWLSASDEKKLSTNADHVVKPTAFITQRPIFAPITMLALNRQALYDYQFLGYEDHQGRSAAVIEAIPKHERKQSIYGRIWIDREDYSILKIEANPGSIKGYDALKELEKKLKTHLQLSLEFEFAKLNNGIRFPTKVSMTELYKGGRYISKLKGPKGWLRTRTTFLYSHYQFFNVNVDVKIDNVSADK